MSILKTRLYKPELTNSLLKREGLLANLEAEKNKPLTLIVAGAGFGQSILVSQRLDIHKAKYGWISFKDDCNDLMLFIRYLIESILINFSDSM